MMDINDNCRFSTCSSAPLGVCQSFSTESQIWSPYLRSSLKFSCSISLFTHRQCSKSCVIRFTMIFENMQIEIILFLFWAVFNGSAPTPRNPNSPNRWNPMNNNLDCKERLRRIMGLKLPDRMAFGTWPDAIRQGINFNLHPFFVRYYSENTRKSSIVNMHQGAARA